MYRLLVVDDEPYIADGLADFFEETGEELLEVYRAYSGIKALELLSRLRMDIVLTDIRMPGLDGLQLLRRIKADWPFCKVIFLTGHQEFDYAYQAAQVPDCRFMLKLEGYDRIRATVLEVVAELEQGRQGEMRRLEFEQQLEQNREVLQGEYLLGLLRGEEDAEGIPGRMRQLRLSFSPNAPLLLVVGQPAGHWLAHSEISSHRHTVRLAVRAHLGLLTDRLAVFNNGHYVVTILQPSSATDPATGPQDFQSIIRGNLELVQAACLRVNQVGVSFALGWVSQWQDMSDHFLHLQSALTYRNPGEAELLLSEPASSSGGVGDSASILRYAQERDLELFRSRLGMGEEHEATVLLKQILQRMKAGNGGQHEDFATESYFSVALVLLSCASRWDLQQPLAEKIDTGALMQFGAHAGWEGAARYLECFWQALLDTRRLGDEDRLNRSVLFVQDYIHGNLAGDLSLTRLAELTHFNPSYLSRLFKAATGETLSDYITAAKMEKAKQLLRQGTARVQDVGRAVGYESTTNFIRFFRRMAGMTPNAYRNAE